jgi:sugar phosphate isomerase/epimerase
VKYATFTVGQPETTPRETIEQLASAGYTGAEWRITVDKGDTSKPGYWSGNRTTLQTDWPDAKFEEVASWQEELGIEAAALGTYVSCAEPDEVERMMEIANILGAPCIRVGPGRYDGSRSYRDIFDESLKQFGTVAELAGKYGVKAGIETHPGLITTSASGAYLLPKHFPPEQVGVIHDAGNLVTEGYEHYQMAFEMLGDHLAHVHIKTNHWTSEPADPPLTVKWKAGWCPLRKGVVDFTFLLKSLQAVGYDGWLSFEDFSDEASQEEKVLDNIAFVKEIEAGL